MRWLLDHPRIGRFVRYGIGSALASVTSAITLAIVYRVFGAGPQVASVTAFLAGAFVNFLVYRFWAWRSTMHQTRMTGDVVKYAMVAITTALIALGSTTLADHYATAENSSGWVRTLVIEGAYFGSFAVTFVAKFLVLDRIVFRARHHHEAAAAAKARAVGEAAAAQRVGGLRPARVAAQAEPADRPFGKAVDALLAASGDAEFDALGNGEPEAAA